MYNLNELKQSIISSGSITKSDVSHLREVVYQDGRVNRAEANFLFDLHNELLNLGNIKAWDDFFIQAICDHLLGDPSSPHAIDNQEASWLLDKIGEDTIIDDVEKELLQRLQQRAKHLPSNLQQIQKRTSVLRTLGRRILQILCHNTKTARSLEYGVNKIGKQKREIFHKKTSTDEDY